MQFLVILLIKLLFIILGFWILLILFMILDLLINGIKNGGKELWLDYFFENLKNENFNYSNLTNSV